MSGAAPGRRRPITKELPKGTLLETLVNNWLQVGSSEDWKESSDPDVRAIGVYSLRKREPREWALPKDFYIEHVLLPRIEHSEGPEIADKWRLSPGNLDRYADLEREEAKRNARARDRLPPKPDIEAYVVMTVMAVLYCDWVADEKPTSRYVRTAKLLGIERNAVRRIVERFGRGFARANAEWQEALAASMHMAKQFVWSLPEFVEARNKGRAEMFVAQRSVSSGFEHDAARSFGG